MRCARVMSDSLLRSPSLPFARLAPLEHECGVSRGSQLQVGLDSRMTDREFFLPIFGAFFRHVQGRNFTAPESSSDRVFIQCVLKT